MVRLLEQGGNLLQPGLLLCGQHIAAADHLYDHLRYLADLIRRYVVQQSGDGGHHGVLVEPHQQSLPTHEVAKGLTDEGAPARRTVLVDARDLGLGASESQSPKQTPFAAIVGCSDARVPVELVFNVGPNDLFVVRVAGNVLGAEVLGSLHYAIEHLGGKIECLSRLDGASAVRYLASCG